MLRAIDETLLVPILHVLFKSAFIQDAKGPSRRRAREAERTSSSTFTRRRNGADRRRRLDVDSWSGICEVAVRRARGGVPYVNLKLAPKLEPTMTGWMGHAPPSRSADSPVRGPAVPVLMGRPTFRLAATTGYDIIRRSASNGSAEVEAPDRASHRPPRARLVDHRARGPAEAARSR
jgi:hypothetical protein